MNTMSARASTNPARVAMSESELLTVARAVVGHGGHHFVPLLRRRRSAIKTIGPTAMGLLQQTLARGVPLALLRRGGWQERRTLVDGQPRRGRLWQRHPTLFTLSFGRASFELLTWLHREDVALPRRPLAHHEGHSLGDELLHYLALEQLLRASGDPRQEAFLRSPLCQLGYPDVLVGAGDEGALPQLDFGPLARGDGALVLEALQPDLARRWLEIEDGKGEIVELAHMARVGGAQDQVLGSLFGALDRAEPDLEMGRRDLASFVAEAGAELLAHGPRRLCPDPRYFTGSLDLRAPLSARQQAFSAAAALLRGVLRLGGWLDQAGLVAHFDEDYEAAQMLLSTWSYLRARPEGEGSSILDRAAALARELESLHSLGVSA